MTLTEPELRQLLEARAPVVELVAEDRNIPEVLYHYTSADGLIGILQTTSFWLTDLRYVNDSSELQYARNLVRRRIEARMPATNLTVLQEEFLRRARQTFDPFQAGASVFATSFCEDGNLLSQWRAYRGRGGGYALGVDFLHTLRRISRECVLRRVIYDVERQLQLVDKLIEGFLTSIHTACGSKSIAEAEEFLPAACRVFAASVGEILFAMKHPDFREEREWRLVFLADVNPRIIRGVEMPAVRSYEGNVIPYFSVGFGAAVEASKDDTLGIPFPIRELVIGPTHSAGLNDASVRALLLSLSPDVGHCVRRSEIPLRWQ